MYYVVYVAIANILEGECMVILASGSELTTWQKHVELAASHDYTLVNLSCVSLAKCSHASERLLGSRNRKNEPKSVIGIWDGLFTSLFDRRFSSNQRED